MTRLREVPLGKILERSGEPVPVMVDGQYRTAGIRSFGNGIFERPCISGAETKYSTYWRIRSEQFVFSRLFAWEGAVAVAGDEHDGLVFSSEFPIFDIDQSQLLPAFAVLMAQWPGLHEKLRDSTTGVGNRRQRVNPDRFLSVRIPLPSVDEQRRIVAKLDASLTELPVVAKRRDQLVDATSRSLLNAAFPMDLPLSRFGDLFELERVPASIEPTHSYSQIGIRSFGNGIFHRSPMLGSDLSKLNYYEVAPKRLIFSNIMAWEGAIACSRESEAEFIASQRFLQYRPTSRSVAIKYLNFFFRSERGMLLLREGSTGSVKRNQTLSPRTIESFVVPCPDIQEQHRVVKLLDKYFASVRQLSDRRDRIMEALRPALLNAAFSGQL